MEDQSGDCWDYPDNKEPRLNEVSSDSVESSHIWDTV